MSLYYKKNEHLQGMLAVNVDDTLAPGNKPLKTLTEEIPQTLESKPR